MVYGAFKRNNQFTTDSNRAFDEDLKGRNSAWGLRNLEDIVQQAAEPDEQGSRLKLEAIHEMPANNFMVVWKHQVRGSLNKSISFHFIDRLI
jgi:hypothetical protein